MMLAILLEAAARSLALGAAAWLVLRLMRVHNLRAERLVWLIVLCGSLLMPLVMQWRLATLTLPAPASGEMPRAGRAPAFVEAAQSAPPVRVLRSESFTPEKKVERKRTTLPFRLLAAIAYLCVALVLLLRLAVGLALASRLWRRAARPQAGFRLAFAGSVAMRVSMKVKGPATVAGGILLPEEALEWTSAKLEAVVQHERCHVEQHDFAWGILAKLHAAVFWFSPLSWWLERRLSEVSEVLADEAALDERISAGTYAEVLLEVASSSQPAAWGVAMARSANVGKRVSRILSGVRQPRMLSGPQRVAASLLTAALIVGTGGLAFHLGATQTPPPPPRPAAPAFPAGQPMPPLAPAPPAEPQSQPGAPAAPPPPPPPPEIAYDGNGWTIISDVDSIEGGIPGGIEGGLTGGVEGQVVVKPGASAIVFKRDGVKYVIDDPALVARAKQLAQESSQESSKEQRARLLAKLDSQIERLARDQENFQLSPEEIEKRVEEVRSRLAKLNSELSQAKQHAWTEDDLSHLQGQLAELQERLGARQEELLANAARAEAQAAKLAQELQERSLPNEVVQKRNAFAEEQMQKLLDEALKSGKAKRQ